MDLKLLKTDLQIKEQKVERAIDQMMALHEKLQGVRSRYEHAVKDNLRCFRYPLRMKVVTYEGVINMYYEYVLEKQKEVESLRLVVYGNESDVSDSEDSD